MRNLTAEEHVQNVAHVLHGFLFYVCIVVAAFWGYYKTLPGPKALSIVAPAVAMYLFGNRSLKKASTGLVKGTAE